MRFRCKPTLAESEAKLKRLLSWQPAFAWFPVEVDDGICVWLERVEQRHPGAYISDGDNAVRSGLWISYRLPPCSSVGESGE
jgi:hypothetical protein